ncbi:MAG TPA: hypothetical protein PKH16_00070 [Aequorivita sp.]|nr:hypothetical protein [Aequorivita sp.]
MLKIEVYHKKKLLSLIERKGYKDFIFPKLLKRLESCKSDIENLAIEIPVNYRPWPTRNNILRGYLHIENLAGILCLYLLDHSDFETPQVYNRFGYDLEDLQKIFIHLNKEQLNALDLKFNYRKGYNELLSILTYKEHPYGQIFIDENWNLIGDKCIPLVKIENYYLELDENNVSQMKIIEEQQEVYDNNLFQNNTEIFDYVAVLQNLNQKAPLSLIKKLCPDQWGSIESDIRGKNNITGMDLLGKSIEENVCLTINEEGTGRMDVSGRRDDLIFKILDFCDLENKMELELFESLTLKRKYINNIFNDFSFDIGDLIHSGNYPSVGKHAILYRLLGYNYFDNKDSQGMRKCFQECISLLRGKNRKKSPAFYLDWATCEKQLGNFDKEADVYRMILKDFPYPQYKNRATRFHLAIYYANNRNFKKATSLLSLDNYALLEDPEFWEDKLVDVVAELIKTGYSHYATVIQGIIGKIATTLRKDGQVERSAFILEKINSQIKNNNWLKMEMARSYLRYDTEKAIQIIKDLEMSNIDKVKLTQLYMDYYRAMNSPKVAIEHGKSFLKNNPDIDSTPICFDLANIFASNFRNWEEVRFYFEKTESPFKEYHYVYATALAKDKNESSKLRALKVFQNYFERNPESKNIRAIASFFTCCIETGKEDLIAKLIFEKFKNIRVHEYPKSFISYLYQLQLKLTSNDELSEILLKEALDHAEGFRQQAIVLSNYAKYLMYRSDGSDFEKEMAIEYFLKSYALKPDPKVKLDMAQCHCFRGEFHEALSTLSEIDEESLELKKKSIQLRAYWKLGQYKSIMDMLTELNSKDLIETAYFYLAQNPKSSNGKRINFYRRAINIGKKSHTQLHYAIFLYSIGEIKESRAVVDEIKSNTPSTDTRIELESTYNMQTSIYRPKIPAALIKKIESKLKLINKRDYPWINGINKLLEKHPLNEKLYSLKFEYFLRLKEFNQCEKILVLLIENDLINGRTANLFHRLSQNYYDYSNYFSLKKKINPQSQQNSLAKALYYSQLAVKGHPSIDHLKLFALIHYKQGSFKRHRQLIEKSFSVLPNHDEKKDFNKYIDSEKRKIKSFLWPNLKEDYYSKISFYGYQEKITATILGDPRQKDKSDAIKILMSIYMDSDFHRSNSFFLLAQISTRLSHYYFQNKNFRKAFVLQKKIYQRKIFDEPFIGAFLQTIGNLNNYNFGVKVCEFYLERQRTLLVLRNYGNFLKEKGQYKKSFDIYNEALELPQDDKHIAILNNNILILLHRSVVENKHFLSVSEIRKLSEESYKNIKIYNPFFRYIHSSLELRKGIEKKLAHFEDKK